MPEFRAGSLALANGSIEAHPLSAHMDGRAIPLVCPSQSERLSLSYSADEKPSDTNSERGLGHNHALQLHIVAHVDGWPDGNDLLRRENG